MNEPTIEQVIAQYIKVRDLQAARKKVWEEENEQFNVAKQQAEEWLSEKMDALGVDSLKSKEFGTVFFQFVESATVADWDSILDYILSEERYDLLERRVAKTTVKELMQPNSKGGYDAPPPPGVNFTRVRKISVRRGK